MPRGTLREGFAEFLGTFVLILFGAGVVAQNIVSKGANGSFLAINISWGLGVVMGCYVSIGVSGAHLNPAVTAGLVAAKRFPFHSPSARQQTARIRHGLPRQSPGSHTRMERGCTIPA